MNGVNQRLGRRRGPMTRYYERMRRERLVQLAKELGLKGALARSVLAEDDEFERAYTDGEHSK
jgi:phage terminase small subunit